MRSASPAPREEPGQGTRGAGVRTGQEPQLACLCHVLPPPCTETCRPRQRARFSQIRGWSSAQISKCEGPGLEGGSSLALSAPLMPQCGWAWPPGHGDLGYPETMLVQRWPQWWPLGTAEPQACFFEQSSNCCSAPPPDSCPVLLRPRIPCLVQGHSK